jgi:hypothetical protein
MFFGENLASRAVFPPSYVPAEIAYARMLDSPRAAADSVESWEETQTLVESVLSNGKLQRSFWRGEAAGLPQYLDLLGMVMHLTQDATVPHHVEDTSDRCHPEYEKMVDLLACGSGKPLSYESYYDGSYARGAASCDHLYDADLVQGFLAEDGMLAPTSQISVSERMIQLAKRTSQWDWRAPGVGGGYATRLPDEQFFQASSCEEILSEPAVQAQAKIQFNLAVAETVALFEVAAHEYETQNAGSAVALSVVLKWFEAPK